MCYFQFLLMLIFVLTTSGLRCRTRMYAYLFLQQILEQHLLLTLPYIDPSFFFIRTPKMSLRWLILSVIPKRIHSFLLFFHFSGCLQIPFLISNTFKFSIFFRRYYFIGITPRKISCMPVAFDE